jgi:hypothetical protein
MGNIKLIESLFCLRTNQARNRRAIRTQIRTRVDGPLGATTLAFWMCRLGVRFTVACVFNVIFSVENSKMT